MDKVVTNDINNKDQCNNAIEYEPKFDSKFSLSSRNKDPLPVVNVSLRVGNKYKATIMHGLACLCDIAATNRIIKRLHIKPYERKMS